MARTEAPGCRSLRRWKELEGAENRGLPVVADNAVREAQFRAALAHGWELHTHACGDVAMRQTVDLYIKLMDEIRAKNPGADLRWSVIHAYHPIEPKTNMIEEMAAHGIIAVVNPVFNWQECRSQHLASKGCPDTRFARCRAGTSGGLGYDVPSQT